MGRVDRALSDFSEENILAVVKTLANAINTPPPSHKEQLLEAYETWCELWDACIGQDRASEEVTIRVRGNKADVRSFLDEVRRAIYRADVDHAIRIAKRTGLTVGVTPSGQIHIIRDDQISRPQAECTEATHALNLLERAGVNCLAIDEVE